MKTKAPVATYNRKNAVLVIGILIPIIISCGPKPGTQEFDLPEQISFNFDIRPILSDNCYVCHGPDSSTRQAGLRLDLRENATKRLENGKKAIHPGNWQKSELLNRVTSSDPEIMMPPPEMKSSLTEREVALLKRWIDEGAKWEPYWAFIPPEKPKVPDVADSIFINNEIDRFIVNKLESKQLNAAQKAKKHTLARRLSYVLTGMPPDPKKLLSFIEDENANAYEQLVDHYLDSPQFGENWARHWMDLVRYADTRGHEFDYKVIGAWQYRDYLIRAFNTDVPYNQFIMEHLAGDQLESPRINKINGINESVLGTAFFCLTEGKHSPVDLRIDQSERIDNIIDVTSKTFQALTVACAKCHDHKFDPIPTTDYYSMYGMVESTRFTLTPSAFDRRHQLIFDSLIQDQQEIRKFISKNISDVGQTHLDQAVSSTDISNYRVIGDFRDGTVNGWSPDGYSITNALGHPVIQKNRLVALEPAKVSSKVTGKGIFGVLRSPGFIISEDSMLFRAAGKNSVVRVIIDNFQLIQDPIYGELQTHLKSEELRDYKIDVSMWKGHHAYIELLVGDYMRRKDKGTHEYDLDPAAWLEVEYVMGYDSLAAPIVRETAYSTTATIPQLMEKWASGTASPGEIHLASQWLARTRPAIPDLDQWNLKQAQRINKLYDSIFVVGVTDGDHIQSPVFIRGSLKNLSQYKVPHRFLTALSDTSNIYGNQGSGRLHFAQNIAQNNNPLTARVMVNRIWHHIFGRGIVETVDNFGVQGKIPSHPELLDFLAIRFMEQGWSIKSMIKYMVMSQTFQRSTESSAESQVVDPNNILLQHYPVRRLNAESIRDAILATSGQLDTTMYGPPVPVYLTEFLKGRGRPRKSGPLDGDGRRSIYQALNRNFLPPMMLAFDMPVPFSTFGRRNVSNVPSQSLTLLNDPFVGEQAECWAHRVIDQETDFEKRVREIYLTAFSRLPHSPEIEQAYQFFEEQLALHHINTEVKPSEKELWKSYCHSIFNMKEFIFLI